MAVSSSNSSRPSQKRSRPQFYSIKRSSEFDEIYKTGRKLRPTNWLMIVVASDHFPKKWVQVHEVTSPNNNDLSKAQKISKDQNSENPNEPQLRKTYFGITASRKVGSAVIRNKLKRWIRALAKEETWPKGLLYKRSVFVFRPQPEGFYKDLEFKEFKAVLESLK